MTPHVRNVIVSFVVGLLVPDPWTVWRLWTKRDWIAAQVRMAQARRRMRARVARWIYQGRLTPIRTARKGKIVVQQRRVPLSLARGTDAAERDDRVSDVRRDDPA